MFYDKQALTKQIDYEENLKIIGSLSNLFSDSKTPYLYYRIAEKIFCNSFNANDLSRGDVALDAVKDGIGIGLKTFLSANDKSFQKVAEFNKDKPLYEEKSPHKIVDIISNLRNQRIEFAQKLYGIEKSFYHCVVRDDKVFRLYEEEMHFVDIKNIKDIKRNKNSITFNDSLNDYSFNLSKSTLSKRFITNTIIKEFNVEILLNPLEDIRKCLLVNEMEHEGAVKIVDTLYLPLYGKNRVVFPKSGLNQWNADGRERNINEVYIPVPVTVHKLKPDFFPDKDTPFNLKLPTGDTLSAKLCQEGSKALMSHSNRELGKWILRDVLSLDEGELLTYEKLQTIGIDSVRIDKLTDGEYEINFSSIGSFEEFYLK